jgi:ribosomal-protein-alanine N-acetyltransferase
MNTQVVISPPTPADAEEFLAAVHASRSLLEPWVYPADTPELFDSYLARSAGVNQASYLIRHAECGGLVGFANISNIVRGGFQSGYLGYAAFAAHAGRGLMAAGLRAVIGDAFTAVGLHRLEANIQPTNTRSRALASRLGFRQEGFSPRYLLIGGQWRDHERWAVLAEDWPGGG